MVRMLAWSGVVVAFGLGAVTVGGYGAWRLASLAFQRVFDSFDNHDSAGPLLLAAPVGLAVFVVAAPVLIGLLSLVPIGVSRWLWGRRA